MPTDHRTRLAGIRRFDQLVAYLRDEMDWPIDSGDFEELTFEYTPEELGIDAKNAAKIQEIKRLRPLVPNQPWGIFFVKFEPRRLPVVALRRILGQVALKKRASANKSERQAWAADDLLFVSNYGEGDERRIAFAHFAKPAQGTDLPTLKVLGWDNLDTPLHLDDVADTLARSLAWPDDPEDEAAWRERWRAAFTLRHREVVTTSRELAERLAELARAIRDRIRTALAIETERGPLTRLLKAFRTALVHDLDVAGFADMYAQTIAYGLLSARIADPERKTADDFAAHMRTNPFLRELMETFLRVGGRRGKAGGPGIDFDELGVSEVVGLLDDANMEAVVRDFGDRNPQEDPVIHFYEHFLAAYDKKQKVSRGVFYTPRPVVSFIVRSVDELLRTEFGLADGLADTTSWGELAKRHADLKVPEGTAPDQVFVQILDPATGTGTFLVEVIDLIHTRMVERWESEGHNEETIVGLWNDYVPRSLLPRLHGYELLMAPYAIAHLKVGLKLYETGYRFGSDERARVYLTNSLEPPGGGQLTFDFLPALAHEAEAVNEIKRTQRFTVLIGNPPYSNFGQLNKIPFILDLLDAYKHGLQEKKLNLDDDYLKFFRFGQFVLDRSGSGIMGMITNSSFLDGLTHRRMRESLVSQFSRGWILDLHGNARRGDRGPDGSPDRNVFDIQQGVAISIWVGRGVSTSAGAVDHRDVWGERNAKYEFLLTQSALRAPLERLEPRPEQFFFVPIDWSLADEYQSFPRFQDAFTVVGSGLNTDRDALFIDFDEGVLRDRMQRMFDDDIDAAFIETYNFRPSSSYDPVSVAKRQSFDEGAVELCVYRPFDYRAIYYKPGVTSRPVFEVQGHMLRPNLGLLVCRQSKEPFAVLATRRIATHKLVSVYDRTSLAPLWAYADVERQGLIPGSSDRESCIGDGFLRALASRLGERGDAPPQAATPKPEAVFSYAYGVFYCRSYRARYGEFLKSDYPHIPLPGSRALFGELCELGRELVSLHVMESPRLDRFGTTYAGLRNPEVGRAGWSDGTVWLDARKSNARKGHRATKPGTLGFKGVPEEVWDFHIGGYQVCHKWLKDRRGRTLSDGEIVHYQKIIVALEETIRIMAEIDEVVDAHGGWPDAFEAGAGKAAGGSAATKVIPFRPTPVEPESEDRYVTCVPLVPLQAAAGAFSDPQRVEDDGFEWVATNSRRRLSKGMFVAQVVGKSMEPVIPDGSYCLFRAPVEGTRQSKTVLVELRDGADPETGQRYTVKRYRSEKGAGDDSWRHDRIMLEPFNPDFDPIELTDSDEGALDVIAELIEVLKA